MVWDILTLFLSQIAMPPKKLNFAKNQPTLNQFIDKHQQAIQKGANHSLKIDSLLDKLLKVRADIELKRREEEKLLKAIIKLKIAEGPAKELRSEIADEQYWMMTTEHSLLNRNVGLFDLMLTQYGQTIVAHMESQKEKEAVKGSSRLEQQRQSENNKSLKLQYFENYRSDFANSLQEFQYFADDASKT